MVAVLLSLTGALAPGVFLLHFFYVRDKYHRDPLRRLLKVYLVSCLTVIPAILLEIPLDFVDLGPGTGFLVGLIEEGIKFAFFWWLVARSKDFDEPYDGILYAVAISLGFATVENLLYVASTGSVAVVVMRAFLSVPGHSLWGVVMGSYFGRWKFESDPKLRRMMVMRAFLVPALLHGLFDALIFASDFTGGLSLLLVVAFVIGSWVVAMRMVHSAQAASPFKRPSPMVSPIAALDMRYKYCQRCGARCLRDDHFCAMCGAGQPVRAGASQTRRCERCGANVQPADQFCARCGQTLAAAPPMAPAFKDCPACGARALRDDKFCSRCGRAFDEAIGVAAEAAPR